MSKELFVIISATLADVKDLSIEKHSWKDSQGNTHTLGAFRIGDNLVRETKSGKLQVIQAKKARKSVVESE